MKKTIFSILLSVTVLLPSCGWLDETPSTYLTKASVYQTEAELEAGMYGIYASLHSSTGWAGQQNEFVGSTSLLIHWRSKRSDDRWCSSFKMTLFSNSADSRGYFAKMYYIIANCNKMIDSLPDSPVEESFKTEIEAEARLVRGICYFYLARMFGDVPLVLRSVRKISDTDVTRDKYTDVYAQILKDLDFAEKYMRSYERQEELTGTTGRPCNWAATTYKAAVYHQIGSILSDPEYQFFDTSVSERLPDFSAVGVQTEADAWEKVVEITTDIIEHGPYRLAGDYAQLFRWTEPEDFTLRERIFVIQSTVESGDNIAAMYSLPEYPEGSSNYIGYNNNSGRYRPERYVLQKWARTHGGHLDEDRGDGAQNVYVGCRDPRYDVSYFHTSRYDIHDEKTVKLYPSSGCVKTSSNNYPPYFKKYLSPRYNADNGDADFYVMRYANVFLMRAEAYASLSSSRDDDMWKKAFADIDVIHARARGELDPSAVQSEYPKWEEDRFETRDELIKGIMWERVFELHGEGFEYYDTHRRGSRFMSEFIASPMKEFLQEDEQCLPATVNKSYFSYFYNDVLPETDPVKLKKSVVFAYPSQEIERNPHSVQNDFIWQ